MKILLLCLTVGSAIMGLFDGGDMTAALICALLLIAVICDKEEKDDVL